MIECHTNIDFSNLDKELDNNNSKYWNILLNIFANSNKIQSNEAFLAYVHKNLRTIIDVSNFFVALYDTKLEKYTFPFFIDEKEEKKIFLDLNLKRSLTDYVRRKGKAILVDKHDDDKLIKSGEVDLIGEMAESWIGVPLIVSGKKIGVLVIQSYDKQVIYNEKDLHKIIYAANFIAGSLNHNNYVYELKESKRHFSIAQEVSSFGSFEIDVYNDTWWFSDKALSIFNLKKLEVEKTFRRFRKALNLNAKFNFDNYFAQFIQEGKELDFELEWEAKDIGEFKIIRIRAEKNFINNGRVLKVMGIIQDITEQRNFEVKLEEAKEKAEESDTLKTAFLSNMSHEIRTPMNAIIGFSDLLTEPDISKEETNEYVGLITSSGQVLLRLIDDIIDISKIEAGQLTFYYSKVYVNVLFKELLLIFEKVKKEKSKENLEIIFENEFEDSNFYFYTDETRFKQIVSNFIANAIKFTEKGSVKCSCIDKGDFLEFRIEDTGIGISDENRSVIFKQFGQILNEGRIYQGTGLGLTISRNLVNMLGGEINFTSKVGEGTTFFFTLPFKKEEINNFK